MALIALPAAKDFFAKPHKAPLKRLGGLMWGGVLDKMTGGANELGRP